MDKITFEDFLIIMSYDVLKNQSCIEIEFCIDNSTIYQCSWLGKTVGRNSGEVVYWFGLTADGTQAYEFDSLEQLLSANVFCGKSIRGIWRLVSIIAIDACDTLERLSFYLKTP